MIDEEIASLLEDAGYSFNAGSGRYQVISGAASEDEVDHSSEFVADELGIPVEDLQRWEELQGYVPDTAGDSENPSPAE